MPRGLRCATPAALVCLCSALQGAAGVRLGEQGRGAVALAGGEGFRAQRAAYEDEAEQAEKPDLGAFATLWSRRFRMEKRTQEPLPSSIKLVLGLMTVPEDKFYRRAVRDTWMRREGVCGLHRRKPSVNCSVHVAFVVGRRDPSVRVDKEERSYKEASGMLVLNMSENMNGGKTQLWFRTALELVPWATHIGKMDIDTYPLVTKLLYRLERSRACTATHSRYEFIGRPACTDHCGFDMACESAGCDENHESSQDAVALGGKWGFLQGQFYVMSRALAHRVAWESVFQHQPEDVVVSDITRWSAKHWGFCVRVLRLDAWYHGTNESDAGYMNDF